MLFGAGGMTSDAITRFRKVLPAAGRPDESATAALLRRMEQQGQLGSSRGLIIDASQMQAIATAVLNPLALLHGPPGTGKTTTIGALLVFLRKQHGYRGRILAAAQSNVAVDNMLETALREYCTLRTSCCANSIATSAPRIWSACGTHSYY